MAEVIGGEGTSNDVDFELCTRKHFSIVYNHKRLLSAGHNDDVSITGAPQDGWGWLAQKGFDMIQRDWPLQAYLYLQQTDCYERRQNP